MPTPKSGYFLDTGEQLPGCTTVLGILNTGPLDPLLGWAANLAKQGKSFKEERERSAQLGTAIHEALEHYDRVPERPIWADDTEWGRIRGCHTEWVDWMAEYAPEIVAMEKQMASRAYMTGGTFDLIVRWQGKTYVADWKTGKGIDKHKIAGQLAFYGAAANECLGIGVEGGLIFHFSPGKKLRVLELDMDDLGMGLELFKAARAAYGVLAGMRGKS